MRTIGFYALICQIANEQRHTGQHRTGQTPTSSSLTEQSGAKLNPPVTRRARAAEVIDYGRVNDPATPAPVGVIHLLIHDGPWVAMTVAMANQIARPRRGGYLLRDLGLVADLLEFRRAT